VGPAAAARSGSTASSWARRSRRPGRAPPGAIPRPQQPEARELAGLEALLHEPAEGFSRLRAPRRQVVVDPRLREAGEVRHARSPVPRRGPRAAGRAGTRPRGRGRSGRGRSRTRWGGGRDGHGGALLVLRAPSGARRRLRGTLLAVRPRSENRRGSGGAGAAAVGGGPGVSLRAIGTAAPGPRAAASSWKRHSHRSHTFVLSGTGRLGQDAAVRR